MKSATTPALPETPPGDVTAGIDWASDDHAVCILDGRGREIARAVVEHTSTGLRELTRLLTRHGACEVAIERPDGPVVEALLDAEVTVVVISPNRVKNLRGRYGSAGNKDDRFDAFVLADTLRTDRARLRPLIPDAPDSVALRRACRTRKDLVGHRVATANQLRAHLHDVLPGPVNLFKDLDSAISLAFLTRLDTQDRVDWLTPTRLGRWLASVGYSGRTHPATLHARLTDAPRGLTGPDALVEAGSTHALIAVLTTLTEQIKKLETQISDQLAAHADAHIFTSLPAWPGWPPRPASPARCAPSASGGPATNSCATPSPTSPATVATPTLGPQTSTTEPEHAGMTTPTLCVSPAVHGSTSSGTSGKATPPTTPPSTTRSNASSPTPPRRPRPRRVDTGLLMPAGRTTG